MTSKTRNSADFERRTEKDGRREKIMTEAEIEKMAERTAAWCKANHPEWVEPGSNADDAKKEAAK